MALPSVYFSFLLIYSHGSIRAMSMSSIPKCMFSVQESLLICNCNHPVNITYFLTIEYLTTHTKASAFSNNLRKDSQLPISWLCSVAQSYLTLWDSIHCSPTSFSIMDRFFSRQEYWSRLSFPPPGGLLNPGIKSESPVSPALLAGSLSLSHQGRSTHLPKPKARKSAWLLPSHTPINHGPAGVSNGL